MHYGGRCPGGVFSKFSPVFVGDLTTPEPEGPPQDLVTSEVRPRSFRVSWSPAPGSVQKYRVVYHATSGTTNPEEVSACINTTQCQTYTTRLRGRW